MNDEHDSPVAPTSGSAAGSEGRQANEKGATQPRARTSSPLSAIIIAKNEERVIARCLASLFWCDETIVVDSGSTDRTVEIARGAGARVLIETDWQGPATQRNRGMAAAAHDWCLLLDADEWVTPELRDEICTVLAALRTEAAFRVPRASSYCGQFMRHGGWWPDHVTRLVHRQLTLYEGGKVHERCVPRGSVGTLARPLAHESFRDLEQVLGKVNAYSTWGAQDLAGAGTRPTLTSAVLHGVWTFLRTYLLRAGFLDGRRGFMLAVSNAEGAYYKYAKAMLVAEQRARKVEIPPGPPFAEEEPRGGRKEARVGERESEASR